MSGHESEQVLVLMKELSVLKQLHSEYGSGAKTESAKDAHQLRQQRHREIAEEIRTLPDQKQNSSERSQSSEHD